VPELLCRVPAPLLGRRPRSAVDLPHDPLDRLVVHVEVFGDPLRLPWVLPGLTGFHQLERRLLRPVARVGSYGQRGGQE